jgi:carboxylate-amine ligase
VVAGRRTAAEAAAAVGLAVAVSGAVPLALAEPVVSDNDRYRDMAQTFGQVARRGTTCGMHVHVAISSDEEGVRCLDLIAPWLPVLLAMSANSPFAEGRDTGYASWRTQEWSNWPSAGPTEAFGSVAGYRLACERMIASGAARDAGMLYFDARLSDNHPTLEVRILDAVTDPADVGLLAALVRGLVETALDGWPPGLPTWRAEELRAARWRAARYGTSDHLLDPASHELRPVREVVTALVDLVGARLDAAGDAALVEAGVERVLAATGATRQHAAYERTGSLEGVVDDVVARTADAWASPNASLRA